MKANVMRKTVLVAIMTCMIGVGTAKDNSKDRERVYDAPFDKVWAACVQAASEKYTVTHSDKGSGVLTFHQGLSWRTNSYGMNVGVTVISVTESETKVILNPQKEKSQISSAGSSITKKFFETVDKALK